MLIHIIFHRLNIRHASIIFFSALITCTQTVRAEYYVVGVEDIEYYPIYAIREGLYAGFARELLDNFADASGHTFEYKPFPIKRLYDEFVREKIDFKFPDSSYWQQDVKKGKNVTYSDSVLEYIDGVLVAPENLGKGKAHLKTLGTPRGFTPFDYLDDFANKSMTLHEGNSLKSLMKMIYSQRIDGVYFSIIVARYFLENTEFSNDAVIFDKSLPHSRGTYHLSTIKHPDVMTAFNAYLINNKATVETLKAKYNVTLF